MSTVAENIKTVSQNIQYAFEELFKLLLRKTLRPTLNPLSTNDKTIYNPATGKNEKAYIAYSPDDNINKYSYLLTADCIGWTGDAITNVKMLAKFIKSTPPERKPAGPTLTRNSRIRRSRVAYSEREKQYAIQTGRIPPFTSLNNFIEYLTARNLQNLVSNRKGEFAYTSDVPYTDSFKNLESVGDDIINQTDPAIPPNDSARMSTAMLRVKLFNLERTLADLSVNMPDIYCHYIQMVKIINSLDRTDDLPWLIDLVGNLSFQKWDDLSEADRQSYIDNLGQDFIDAFNSNILITLLLQSGNSELIFKGSYLYSLLKMLFCVFGYSRLIPIVEYPCQSNCSSNELSAHRNQYVGAFLRRNSDNDPTTTDITNCCYDCPENTQFKCCNECADPDPCPPVCPPVDPCIYEHITLFSELYPTIVEIMGGLSFPDACHTIVCGEVPATYNGLTTIPEFLWRYNDYSYCKYLEYINTKQINNVLSTRVNEKIRVLQLL